MYTQQYAIGSVNLRLFDTGLRVLEKPYKPHKFCKVRIILMHVYFPFNQVFICHTRSPPRLLVIHKSEISVNSINYYPENYLPFLAHPKQQTNKLFMHVLPRYCVCLLFFQNTWHYLQMRTTKETRVPQFYYARACVYPNMTRSFVDFVVGSLKSVEELAVSSSGIFFVKKRVLTSTLHTGASLLWKFCRTSDIRSCYRE